MEIRFSYRGDNDGVILVFLPLFFNLSRNRCSFTETGGLFLAMETLEKTKKERRSEIGSIDPSLTTQ